MTLPPAVVGEPATESRAGQNPAQGERSDRLPRHEQVRAALVRALTHPGDASAVTGHHGLCVVTPGTSSVEDGADKRRDTAVEAGRRARPPPPAPGRTHPPAWGGPRGGAPGEVRPG